MRNSPAFATPEAKRRLLVEIMKHEAVGRIVAPLTCAQRELWYFSPFDPEDPSNNLHTVIHIEGPLDLALVERCLNEIASRHEALRTSFEDLEGETFQLISRQREICVRIESPLKLASSLPRAALERIWDQATRELSRDESQRPFSLRDDSLLRLAILPLAPGVHRLFLTVHHAVFDGWSIGVSLRELFELYTSHRVGSAPRLITPVWQYREQARASEEALRGEKMRSLLQYWRNRLEGAPFGTTLTKARDSGGEGSARREVVESSLPAELTDQLKAIARSQRATFFMALGAAFAVLIWSHTEQEDLVIGVPVANRGAPRAAEVIGYLANNLVLRFDLRGNPSFTELLSRVRESTISDLNHQELPFAVLAHELCPDWRATSALPLFRLRMALQNYPLPSLRPNSGLLMRIREQDSGTSRFDMALEAFDSGEGLRLVLPFRVGVFENRDVAEVAERFVQIVRRAVAEPDRRLAAFSVRPTAGARSHSISPAVVPPPEP